MSSKPVSIKFSKKARLQGDVNDKTTNEKTGNLEVITKLNSEAQPPKAVNGVAPASIGNLKAEDMETSFGDITGTNRDLKTGDKETPSGDTPATNGDLKTEDTETTSDDAPATNGDLKTDDKRIPSGDTPAIDEKMDSDEVKENEGTEAQELAETSKPLTPMKTGRPKGSNNKSSDDDLAIDEKTDSDETKENEGIEAQKLAETSKPLTPKKRGRPKGSKNKCSEPLSRQYKKLILKPYSTCGGSGRVGIASDKETRVKVVHPINVRHWIIRRPFALPEEKRIEFVMHETYPSRLNPYDPNI